MSAPNTGTCSPWAQVEDLASPCAELDPDLLLDGLQMASDVLYDFTRRRWPGECTTTVRPCGYRTKTRWSLTGAGWCGCAFRRTCGCRGLSEIRLPGHAVSAVTAVAIDGAVLDASRYRVDNHRWLVYLPESDTATRQAWPCCQRLDRPDTELDTFSVTYAHGSAPPAGGRRAAMTLGCQLATAWTPAVAGQCKLPKRVTTVARQGTTLAVLDPLTLFRDGLTGLEDVDLWVGAVNRGTDRRNATVWSPNGHAGHRFRRSTTAIAAPGGGFLYGGYGGGY